MKKNVVWLVSMTTTLFFVSGIGLVGLAAGGQPAEANLPPINGRIAYSDYSSIWTMESDGSDKKALFGSSNGGLRNPAWSPDGTKLAYDDGSALFIQNSDGTGRTAIPNVANNDDSGCRGFVVRPAWSPDGSKIAFVYFRGVLDSLSNSCYHSPDIYTINLDGTGKTSLTANGEEGRWVDNPSWSPDGNKIVFDRRGEIYTTNADGSGTPSPLSTPAFGMSPSWSSDGTKIAFVAMNWGDRTGQVATMNVDGTDQMRFWQQGSDPAWSPDGSKIVYGCGWFASRTNFDICTMNADGSGEVNLTLPLSEDSAGGPEIEPSWQPLPSTTYDFSGFFAPVDNPEVLNKVKAGSAVPVKFSLGGDKGLDIFAKAADGSRFPKSRAMACDSTDPVDAIEQTVSAGASGLTYDAATDRYTYVWKTQKAWTGCRQLVVKFDDGTVHRANFKLVN